MVLQNLIRRFSGRETKGKLLHQLKQTKGFRLHELPSLRFQHRRLWPREHPELNGEGGGTQYVNGNAIWERGGKVRVYLEMLCNLNVTSCISLIIRKTLQVRSKCAPMLARGDPHSHTHLAGLEAGSQGQLSLSLCSTDEAAHQQDVKAPQ